MDDQNTQATVNSPSEGAPEQAIEAAAPSASASTDASGPKQTEGGSEASSPPADAPVQIDVPAGDGEPPTLKDKIVAAIETCYDPEIPVNIYELGLIYEIKINDETNHVDIDMTLTSPACPAAGSLPPEVEQKVGKIDGIDSVKVEVVWEPTWTPEKMSEAAKLQLGFF